MTDDMTLRAREFADRWRGRGSETREGRTYWLDLLEHVLQVPDLTDPEVVDFERRTAGGGRVDALMVKARVLVEQKSLGVDLDKPEPRQGELKTPVRQALDYANTLPYSERPAVIIVCNFESFRLYDLDADPLCRTPQNEFTLDTLPAHARDLAALFAPGHSRVTAVERMGVEAGRHAAALHERLKAAWVAYRDGDKPASDRADAPAPALDEADHTALAWLTVRIVFCLYAEDAGLFSNGPRPARGDGAFTRLIAGSSDPAADLHQLFAVLDTPEDERKAWQARYAGFPYVDGGLFAEDIDIPPLDDKARQAILDMAVGFEDWAHISPVVFGSLMEETLSHDERRAGGMHYTSVANIHKVIDPLFLDALKRDLRDAEAKPVAGGARRKALTAFHERLGSLRFLDPACGSGNFLTETYLELRRLEHRVILDLHGEAVSQGSFDLGDDVNGILVRISHFAGIEINGFAVAVAKSAMWIAEQQMLAEAGFHGRDRLPFTDSANIIRANALRTDWNTILPGGECDYVMGNPPFIGQKQKSPAQRDDMRLVWGDDYDGYLDYVTGWFRKAASYCEKPGARFAFVATNSICQGQPVPALFKPLRRMGWGIMFAHPSFQWDAQSTDKAGVAVVIVGMSREPIETRTLYTKDGPRRASNINAYLIDGPDIYVEKRMRPRSDQQSAVLRGLQPSEHGGLLIGPGTHPNAFRDPTARKYLRPCIGAEELLSDKQRWCLWLKDATPAEMSESPFIRERLDFVREWREQQPVGGDAYKLRKTPWLFRPSTDYPYDKPILVIPRVSSENREWFASKWLHDGEIVTDSCFVVRDDDGFQFSIISSRMFMVWQRKFGGQLENRIRFSSTVVWNNLPIPHLDNGIIQEMIEAGQGVLDARATYPDSTLAQLYDPKFMPLPLRHAHEELDRIADVAFGSKRWLKDDDDTRLSVLFANYPESE